MGHFTFNYLNCSLFLSRLCIAYIHNKKVQLKIETVLNILLEWAESTILGCENTCETYLVVSTLEKFI